MTDYIVMLSGGLTSFEAGRRAIEKHGHDKVRFWFADTNTEHPDLYRFIAECAALLDHPIERLANDDKDVWDTFYEARFLGNSRVDPCSRALKREPLRKKLKAEYPNPDDAVIILGMDDMEDCHRMERAAHHQLPYKTWFPLMDEPRTNKAEISRWLSLRGIERPVLYDKGFQHNNCGGFCVKAGLGQFAHLYKEFPQVYDLHASKEQEFREWIGKDVSILRDSRGGEVKPMTLEMLRQRIDDGESFPYETGWACMCFIPDDDFTRTDWD